jgi:hypothetical protein
MKLKRYGDILALGESPTPGRFAENISDVTGYARQSVYSYSTAFFEGSLFKIYFPQPLSLTIPIVFGEPITIDGSVSAEASQFEAFGKPPTDSAINGSMPPFRTGAEPGGRA